jgi:hypothetical protein
VPAPEAGPRPVGTPAPDTEPADLADLAGIQADDEFLDLLGSIGPTSPAGPALWAHPDRRLAPLLLAWRQDALGGGSAPRVGPVARPASPVAPGGSRRRPVARSLVVAALALLAGLAGGGAVAGAVVSHQTDQGLAEIRQDAQATSRWAAVRVADNLEQADRDLHTDDPDDAADALHRAYRDMPFVLPADGLDVLRARGDAVRDRLVALRAEDAKSHAAGAEPFGSTTGSETDDGPTGGGR